MHFNEHYFYYYYKPRCILNVRSSVQDNESTKISTQKLKIWIFVCKSQPKDKQNRNRSWLKVRAYRDVHFTWYVSAHSV